MATFGLKIFRRNLFRRKFVRRNFFATHFIVEWVISSNPLFGRKFFGRMFFFVKRCTNTGFSSKLKMSRYFRKKNLNVCAQAISYFFDIFSFMIMSNFENMQNPTKEICQTFRVSNINTQISIIGVSFQLVLCPFQLLIL